MKQLVLFILVFVMYACGPEYCDKCVETEHTISNSTGVEDLSVYSANMVTEFNTYFRVGVWSKEVEWKEATFKMYQGNTILVDQQENVQIGIKPSSNEIKLAVLTFSIEDIVENGDFPEGEVFFEGTLSSDDHTVRFTGSTHFYLCENTWEGFDRTDCRFSCQLGEGTSNSHPCSSQTCPF